MAPSISSTSGSFHLLQLREATEVTDLPPAPFRAWPQPSTSLARLAGLRGYPPEGGRQGADGLEQAASCTT